METSSFTIALVDRLTAARGIALTRGMRVLDFGCGDGAHVYEWLDAGFDAHGFDIHRAVRLRSPDDDRRFVTTGAAASDSSDMTVDASFRLPYEDGTFDVVVSQAVLEHVAEPETVVRELSRVTRRPGIGVHTFPASYTWREPHVGVPLASFFRPRWWLRAWAELGVRNEFQRGQVASAVAEANARYLRTGAFYRPPSVWLRLCRAHFEAAAFDPTSWQYPARRYAPLRLGPIAWLFTRVGHCVLVTVRSSAPPR